VITLSQEEWLWDLFQSGIGTVATSSWEQSFLADNMKRWEEDHVAYFLSPKMKQILRRIDERISSL
jgi:hypothetical protein